MFLGTLNTKCMSGITFLGMDATELVNVIGATPITNTSAFTPLQVYNKMLQTGTLGNLTLGDVTALLRLGARRGIFTLSCSNGVLSYNLNLNMIQQNYANRVFASSEILNAGGKFTYVKESSRCGACPTAGGLPNGTGYNCCPCTLAANPTTCSATAI